METQRQPATDSLEEIKRLLYRYAELVDSGDFDGVAALFGESGIYQHNDGSEFYRDEIAARRRRTRLNVSLEGRPTTKHVTTNLQIEVDEAAGTATARSEFMVLQATSRLPLQVVVSGRYHDRIERSTEGWRFIHRRTRTDLVGRMDELLRGS